MTSENKTSTSPVEPAEAPDGADKFRDAGIAAFGRGEWQQALEGLLEAHRRRPSGPFIRLHLSQVLLELGRAEEALLHLDTLLPENTVYPDLEPLLSKLRARAKDELLVNSAASTKIQDAAPTKTKDGFISRLKRIFAKPL